MEPSSDLLSKLQDMKDWNKSSIFTDARDVVVDN